MNEIVDRRWYRDANQFSSSARKSTIERATVLMERKNAVRIMQRADANAKRIYRAVKTRRPSSDLCDFNDIAIL